MTAVLFASYTPQRPAINFLRGINFFTAPSHAARSSKIQRRKRPASRQRPSPRATPTATPSRVSSATATRNGKMLRAARQFLDRNPVVFGASVLGLFGCVLPLVVVPIRQRYLLRSW